MASELTGSNIDQITSPTFLMMHLYEGKAQVAHFDLYRLTQPETLTAMGLDELFGVADLCCIEWPERIEGFPMPNRWNVQIKQLTQESRQITYGPYAVHG
jgi:tRNA threonylcarbamoyladenosine biosynthesis protein TsaE